MSSDNARPVALTVIGAGAEAGRWSAAFRSIEGVAVDRAGDGEADALDALSAAGRDAAVIIAPHADVMGAVRSAALAGRNVFVAGTHALGSKQLLALADLSRRRGRAIVFDDGVLGDEQLAFVRKMTSGPNALWRPRYIRALRTGDAGATLDAVMVTELARVIAVAGAAPYIVSGVTPRIDDESGTADVALLTLWFEGGPVARVDVSLVEPSLRREMVLGCDARTLVLQPLDREAPLLIHATSRHRGPAHGAGWSETVTEHPVAEPRDQARAAADAFVAAVRGADAGATNAEELARAALTWERARVSIAHDGEPMRIDEPQDGSRRRAFEVILGGGHTTEAHEAPRLTLVGTR